MSASSCTEGGGVIAVWVKKHRKEKQMKASDRGSKGSLEWGFMRLCIALVIVAFMGQNMIPMVSGKSGSKHSRVELITASSCSQHGCRMSCQKALIG